MSSDRSELSLSDLVKRPQGLLEGRYEIGHQIGVGGSSEVWTALDQSSKKRVAIKILRREFADDKALVERFRREAGELQSLRHPNIAHVLGGFVVDGRPAIVTDLVEGKPLRRLLDEGRLSWPLVAQIGEKLADALVYLHAAGIVHRDVKPENILIGVDGRVVLIDFGIAKYRDTHVEISDPRTILGSMTYISPEVLRGEQLDGRCDIYSLGIVLYECLVGRVPISAQDPSKVAEKRLLVAPPDIDSFPTDVPSALAEVVVAMMSVNPLGRPQSGEQLRFMLNNLELPSLDSPAPHAPHHSTPVRSRAPQWNDTVSSPRVDAAGTVVAAPSGGRGLWPEGAADLHIGKSLRPSVAHASESTTAQRPRRRQGRPLLVSTLRALAGKAN